MERVLFPQSPGNPEADKAAVREALRLCGTLGVGTLVIVVPFPLKDFESCTLAPIFGPQLAKQLTKGPVAVKGVTLRLTKQRRGYRCDPRSGVLMAYAEDPEIEAVEDEGEVEFLVVLPHTDERVRRWRASRAPRELPGVPPAPAAGSLDPVVSAALRVLTDSVNLASGLSHPNDKAKAKDIAGALRESGYEAPSGQVQTWAVGNGWRSDAAAQLQLIFDRTKKRPKDRWFRDDCVEGWKRLAVGEDEA